MQYGEPKNGVPHPMESKKRVDWIDWGVLTLFLVFAVVLAVAVVMTAIEYPMAIALGVAIMGACGGIAYLVLRRG